MTSKFMVSNLASPPLINIFNHTVVGLSGDVAMSIDASALDTHLRKTNYLAGINSIIVLKLIKYEDFKLYVYKHINKYIHNYIQTHAAKKK